MIFGCTVTFKNHGMTFNSHAMTFACTVTFKSDGVTSVGTVTFKSWHDFQ